jgi:hypothetical protein
MYWAPRSSPYASRLLINNGLMTTHHHLAQTLTHPHEPGPARFFLRRPSHPGSSWQRTFISVLLARSPPGIVQLTFLPWNEHLAGNWR